MILRSLLFSIILLFFLIKPFNTYAFCQKDSVQVNPENFYRAPKVFDVIKNVVKDFKVNHLDDSDDSKSLQNAINKMSKKRNGGKLIIPKGKYYLMGVKLKSNVHIEIEEGVEIYPTYVNDNRNHTIFEFAPDGYNRIENVSIIGLGKGYTIDLRNTTDKRLAIFKFGNINNFKLSNFIIQDNKTIFASLLFGLSEYNGKFNWPTNGLIEKGRNYNADVGYGLVQMYAANNIFFKDIFSEGGVTLRLETDNLKMKRIKKGGVDEIYAKNVSCENGLSAVMFSPHFMQNGKVEVDGVYAKSCAFAVKVEQGFVEVFGKRGQSRKKIVQEIRNQIGNGAVKLAYLRGTLKDRYAVRIKNEFSKKALEVTGLKPGTFKKSLVTNVKVDYGENAVYKGAYLPYISCEKINKVCMLKKNVYKGSSVAAVLNRTTKSEYGNYMVEIKNITTNDSLKLIPKLITSRTKKYKCQKDNFYYCD